MEEGILMNLMVLDIEPHHLLYRILCALPGMEQLTDLEKLVMAGLLLFTDKEGKITMTGEQRRKIEEGLNLSSQGMTNLLNRLILRERITREKRGDYLLTPSMLPLAQLPKELKKEFTIKFVTNKQ